LLLHDDNIVNVRPGRCYYGSALSFGDLSAEQIVSRFAESAGLSLSDVITNYAQYASAIHESFTSHLRKFHCCVLIFLLSVFVKLFT